MRNQFRYLLIIVLAFTAGILTYAFYQHSVFTNKTASLEPPSISQSNEQTKVERFNGISSQTNSLDEAKTIGATPAFDELALHESKIKTELNSLLLEYQPTSSNVLQKRFELEITQLEIAKILATSESEKSILTFVYGKLLVRKIVAEAELRDSILNNDLESGQSRKKAAKLQAIEKEISEFSSDLEEGKKF